MLLSNVSPNGIPTELAIGRDGNLVYASNAFNSIERYSGDSPTGLVKLGSPGEPLDLAVDSHNNVFTANHWGSISRITPAGAVTHQFAKPGDYAQSLAIDSHDNVFTADGEGHLFKLSSAGTTVATYDLDSHGDDRSSDILAVDSHDNVFAVGRTSGVIAKITPAGVITQTFASVGSGDHLGLYRSIAIDSHDTMYVTNPDSSTVSRITGSGAVTATFATLRPGSSPAGIAIDPQGGVVTADTGKNGVSRISAAGAVTSPYITFGAKGEPGSRSGFPTTVAVKANGAIYASGGTQGVIIKIAHHARARQKVKGAPVKSLRKARTSNLPRRSNAGHTVRWDSRTPRTCRVSYRMFDDVYQVTGKRRGKCVIRARAAQTPLLNALSKTFKLKIK